MDAADTGIHGGTLIAQGSIESYEYKIIEHSGYRYSDVKVTGPINLNTRIGLYKVTLPYVVTGNYFGRFQARSMDAVVIGN